MSICQLRRNNAPVHKKLVKKFRNDKKGVSDIIANILILAITVALFSTVFYWVFAIPVPATTPHYDLQPTLIKVGNQYWLNITHKGGNAFTDVGTLILLSFPTNNTLIKLHIHDSKLPLGAIWNIGEVWSWTFNSASTVNNVLVYIQSNNQVVWQSNVQLIGQVSPTISDAGTNPSVVITNTNFIAYADVVDPTNIIDPNNVYVDLTSLGLGNKVPMSYDIYTSRWETGNQITVKTDGNYPATVYVTDLTGHVSTKSITITVSVQQVGGKPDLTIIPTDIMFSTSNPSRGDTVLISAVITNLGSVAAQSANVTLWDNGIFVYSRTDVSVPGYGTYTVYTDWVASPGGMHTITVTISNVYPAESNTGNNQASNQIVVMPTILLVNDCGALAGTFDDVDVYMETALQSCDFKYTLHTVAPSADGPPATSSDPTTHPLMNYDVVIWITGNTTTNTLTTNDQANIAYYLNHKGSLWLIGQDVLDDLHPGNSFIQNYLHVNSFITSTEPTKWLFGVNKDKMGPITTDIQPVNTTNTNRIPRRGDYITSFGTGGDTTRKIFNDTANRTVGISYNTTYRLVFFPWEFSEIYDIGMQAVITYKMITWLGNITHKSGDDVAVSSQSFTPKTPHFMEAVNITADVRNNGPTDLTNVRVVFRVDGVTIPTAPDGKPNPQLVNLAKNGGMASIWKKWLPRTVGTHTITVEINPDRSNPPTETNYQNNILTSALSANSVYVEYNVLVVNDDGSSDNAHGIATNPDVVAPMGTALNTSGLGGSWDEYPVDTTGNGPSATYMSNYTTIIWMTGNTTTKTLTAYDMAQIATYLKDNLTSIWIIGKGILADPTVRGNATFYTNYLRVKAWDNTPMTTLNPIYGEMNDEITHGMKISVNNIFGSGYSIVPFIPTTDVNTQPIFMRDATNYWATTTECLGVKYQDPAGYRVVFMPWEFASIKGGEIPDITSITTPTNPTTNTNIQSSPPGPAPLVRINTFDFENTWNGWTGSGDVINAHNDHPFSGSYDIRIGNGGTNTGYINQQFDFSSYATVNLYFFIYARNCLGSPNASRCYFSVLVNDGTNGWHRIWEGDGGTYNNGNASYSGINVPLTYTMSSTYQIRFVGYVPSGANTERWYLDYVFLEGTTYPTPVCTVNVPTTGFDLTGNTPHLIIYNVTSGTAPFTNGGFLRYTTDGGTTFTLIIGPFTPVSGMGFYSWNVPSINSNNVQIQLQVTDSKGKTGTTLSNVFIIDSTPPAVSPPTNPSNTMIGVPRTSTIQITFTEAMDHTSTQNAFSLTSVPPYAGTFTFTWAGNQMTATPLILLSYNTTYTCKIAATAKDVSSTGNPMTAAYSFWFTTEIAPQGPSVSIISPTGGEQWLWGSTQNILWHATAKMTQPPYVTINLYYSTDDGTTWHALKTGYSNVGIYPWLIPSVASTTCRVRVQAYQGALWSNATSGDFTIGQSSPAIDGASQRSELAYNVIHWFGRIELLPELRITPPDIYYGNETTPSIQFNTVHPVLGQSFVLKAKIWNLGGEAAGTTVRIMDGKTEIGSANVYVPPSYIDVNGKVINTNTVVEVIWVPLYAGLEDLSVVVDPDSALSERFKFNDQADQNTYVYFFYDDMESGAGKWKHESTIMRINGESPIEYFDPPANTVNTKVISSFQSMSGFKLTSSDSYSSPYSYKMFEPYSVYRVPVDVTFMIDTSGSMGDVQADGYTKLQDAQKAAWSVIAMLNKNDRCVLFDYPAGAPNGPLPNPPGTFMWMTPTNASIMGNYINGTGPGGVTPLWDTMQDAMNYAYTHQISTNLPFVIALTDGDDNGGHGSGITGTNGDETGSSSYCPGGPVGGAPYNSKTGSTWGLAVGNTWAQATTRTYGSNTVYRYAGGAFHTGTLTGYNARKGIYNAPILTYTVGLGVAPQCEYTNASGYGEYISSTNWGWRYTTEYDLNTTATTSTNGTGGTKHGQYFYAAQASQLTNIFQQIFLIASGAAASSLPPPPTNINSKGNGNTVMSDGNQPASLLPKTYPSGVNGDNYTVTQSFTLPAGLASARLTFYHKYRLVSYINGLVVMLGMSSDNVNFKYKYIQPIQPYTGNLNSNYILYDWNGNGGASDQRIRWAYTGTSGNGKYTWDYAEFDLSPYIGSGVYTYYRVLFQYFFLGGGNSGSYYLDNIEVKETRGSVSPLGYSDQWDYISNNASAAHSGSGYWWNHDPGNGNNFADGIDDALVTQPVDLTLAKNPWLSAYFKFNVFWGAGGVGRPPDGFRVEVSSDNGRNWNPLSLGVRSGWNVSGTENTHDGISDGTSYTGIISSADSSAGKLNWVEASTLYRLQVNLTGWRGSVILIRFRVVTFFDPANPQYKHYAQLLANDMGLYLDDVKVSGDTLVKG